MGLRRKKKRKVWRPPPTQPTNERRSAPRRRGAADLQRRYGDAIKKKKIRRNRWRIACQLAPGPEGTGRFDGVRAKDNNQSKGETKKQKQNDNNRKTSKPQKARPFNQSAVADRIQVRDNETTRVGKKEKNNDQTGIYETIERRLASTT